jgi:hypothetical protein
MSVQFADLRKDNRHDLPTPHGSSDLLSWRPCAGDCISPCSAPCRCRWGCRTGAPSFSGFRLLPLPRGSRVCIRDASRSIVRTAPALAAPPHGVSPSVFGMPSLWREHFLWRKSRPEHQEFKLCRVFRISFDKWSQLWKTARNRFVI